MNHMDILLSDQVLLIMLTFDFIDAPGFVARQIAGLRLQTSRRRTDPPPHPPWHPQAHRILQALRPQVRLDSP